MSTLQEIESAITQLCPSDLAHLRAWFIELDADAWDRQIEADVRSGRLNALYESLQRENGGELDIPLHEVVHQEELP